MTVLTNVILLDRYRLETELGRGGMGTVYRAFDSVLERDVAIKVILPEIANDPLFRKRFEKEAHLAAQLQHTNIVPLHDYWQDETHAYLVMRWLQGGNLKEALVNGPIDPIKAVQLVDQITGALETAHQNGVVHRDIKPSNIMLDELGNAYLTDFGIAKRLDSKTVGTAKGTIIGSPEYMAPEQIKGEPVTPLSDQYSLGGVIYEMLTGEPPFVADEMATLLFKQLNEPIPLVYERFPELPPAVDIVLQKATAKEPDQRYADVSRLAEAFAMAISQPELISAEPYLGEKAVEFAHNLPVQSTPFVGREEELATLEGMLIDPEIRLITIVGPGGIGKTRLALALAERQLGNFEHGVFFVSLASLDAVEDIVPAVAYGLGFSFYEGSDYRRQLIDYLRAKSMLLLLDNFERLLDGALLAAEIVQAAPGIRVVVTSREPLRLLDEQLLSIHGFDIPDLETTKDSLENDAVQLFLNSARRNRSGFDLTQGDLQPLTRIFRLVQGMPLGIILAASWVELLSLSDIADELSQGIDILKTDLRDVPERQRSMQIVFESTWKLLDKKERDVLERLSVFRGGSSHKAIQQVTGATLLELKSLSGKSLIDVNQEGRHEMHELLRQYAAEKLEADPEAVFEAHDRHCAYYLYAIAELEDDLYGPQAKHVMAEIDGDLENVRSALRWAASNQRVEYLDGAINPLFQYYFWRDLHQSLFRDAQIIVDGLASADSPEARLITAKALARQGWFLPDQEDLELVMKSEATVRRIDPAPIDFRKDKAFILMRLGGQIAASDPQRGLELSKESLELFRELGDLWGEAAALNSLAHHATVTGNFEEEKRLRERSQTIYEQMGNPVELAESLYRLAWLAADLGEELEAECLARQSYETLREFGYPNSVGRSSRNLGMILYQSGRFEEALEQFKDARNVFEDLGHELWRMYCKVYLAWTYIHIGEYNAAEILAGQCLNYFEPNRNYGGFHFTLACLALIRKDATKVRRHAQKNLEIVRGHHLVGQLWCLLLIGLAERIHGNESAFRRQLVEVLRIVATTKVLGFRSGCLPEVALLFADRGDAERAVEIYGLACQRPFVTNSQWMQDIYGKPIMAAAEILPPEVAEAARQRGRERDPWETAKEILAELEAEEAQD